MNKDENSIAAFEIGQDGKQLMPLNARTLSDIGYKEHDLQAWLVNTPNALGEELLIIQKEFAGFAGTNERLDLLALDIDGNLVIIENKRDDTGRDVTWQALKYVAYCSTLTKQQIIDIYQDYLNKQNRSNEDSEELICKFLDVDSITEIELNSHLTQRFILVATYFPLEVTSTVLWLIDNRIDARCMKITPYNIDKKTLLNITQIIPPPGTEEHMISMASKDQEEKEAKTSARSKLNQLRREFWNRVLNHMRENKFQMYRDARPTPYTYLKANSGIEGCFYTMGIYEDCVWVSFAVWCTSAKMQKNIYNHFVEKRSAIQNKFGNDLEWENGSHEITYYKWLESYEEANWPKMSKWLFENSQKIEKTFKPFISEFKKKN